MADSLNIQKLIRETFEKHHIENIPLQNALTEIFEIAIPPNTSESSSTNILSEKLRDEPRGK